MKVCAIIPARGGSKGIPRKNLCLVAGKPLIAHTVECAAAARSIERVVVSTDDAEVAGIANACGGQVVWRPSEISGDRSPSEAALLHALHQLRETEAYEPDLLVFLQCTSPLTLSEDIDGAVAVLLRENADSVVSVAPFHHFLWLHDANGEAAGINHDKRVRLPRQLCQPQYLETGAVYVMRAEGFLRARHRFFGKTGLYVMPGERCLEIDEPVDLEVAEVLAGRQGRERGAGLMPDPVAALVLDFDGVFTDNRVVVDQDGREAVACDRRDGWGLAELRRAGVPMLVLSTETNPVVRSRCEKLGIPCMHGVQDKLAALHDWCRRQGLDLSGVIYIGNDVNDVACMRAVGCAVAVADAEPEAKAVAKVVLSAAGGHGAIRQLADLISEKLKAARLGA